MTTINLKDVQVARSLNASEHAIDDALIEGSDYLRRLIESRRTHNFAAEVVQDAISASVETLGHLVAARAAQVRSRSAIGAVAEALLRLRQPDCASKRRRAGGPKRDRILQCGRLS